MADASKVKEEMYGKSWGSDVATAEDKARADASSDLDALWSALSYPQRKLKEAVSGNENRWFPAGAHQRMGGGTFANTATAAGVPPLSQDVHDAVSAVGGAVGDVVLDPLNFVPISLFSKATRAVPSSNLRGLALSSPPNYIDNHYGLPRNAPRATETEKVLMKALPDKMLEDQKVALLRKGKGFADWATQGVGGALKTMASPTARATYADTGVNQNVQNIVKRLQAGDDPQAVQKAVANINYNQHINRQAGRTGDMAPEMREVGERSNLIDYQDNKQGTISTMMQDATGTVSDRKPGSKPTPNPVSAPDANYIEQHVSNVWGGSDQVVMKRGQSMVSGSHHNDLYRKSPFTSAVSQAFMQHGGKPTLRQLYDSLSTLQSKQKGENKFRIKNKDWDDVQKNGLWLTGSIKGSAITEGGVNWLGKVDPSGELTGVISDKHDFLEKIPGLGKMIEKRLPNDLLAVSPPMKASIQALRKNQFAEKGIVADKLYSGVPTPKADNTTEGMLSAYTDVKPTAETLKAEQLRQGGMLSVPATLYQDDRSTINTHTESI